MDCAGSGICCAACLSSRHALLPFHSVERWNGSHFERAWLGSAELGVKIHLGHEGERCPTLAADGAAEEKTSVQMRIGHLNGLHKLAVIPCACRGPRQGTESFLSQLVRARLFPGTLSRPTTAYTLEMIEHWHMESLQSKKSTWDYWQALCQKTTKGVDRVRLSPSRDSGRIS